MYTLARNGGYVGTGMNRKSYEGIVERKIEYKNSEASKKNERTNIESKNRLETTEAGAVTPKSQDPPR